MQNIIQCLLDDYKVKKLVSFNKDDFEILLEFDFYILLVDVSRFYILLVDVSRYDHYL